MLCHNGSYTGCLSSFSFHTVYGILVVLYVCWINDKKKFWWGIALTVCNYIWFWIGKTFPTNCHDCVWQTKMPPKVTILLIQEDIALKGFKKKLKKIEVNVSRYHGFFFLETFYNWLHKSPILSFAIRIYVAIFSQINSFFNYSYTVGTVMLF